MRNKEDVAALIAYLQATVDEELQVDDDGIAAAYQQTNEHQSLAIKILSVFGGILASLALVAFLFIVGLYNSGSGLLLFGAVSIAGAIWINKVSDKIIVDTLSNSFFIIGFILLGLGLAEMRVEERLICLVFIVIALCTLAMVQNYILSFISVLVISGSLLTMIMLSRMHELIHLYVAGLALVTTFLFLQEARILIMSKAISRLYNPTRIALIISLLAGLVILGKGEIWFVAPGSIWLSSVVIIGIIVVLLSRLVDVLDITSVRQKTCMYVFSIFLLLPTAFFPAIPGTILIILLSFLVNYKTGLVLGIVGCIYFIAQSYYDLNLTLLTKSILLMSSGAVIIGMYLLTRKALTSDEKL